MDGHVSQSPLRRHFPARVLSLLARIQAGAGRLVGQRGYDFGNTHWSGRGDVILVRGAAAACVPYWPGAPDLAARLATVGFLPTIINHYEVFAVAEALCQMVREGRVTRGISLVGYSFGADSACLLADELAGRGIRVDALVLVESTWGIPVPGNVDACINYYKPRLLDFIPSSRGVPVAATSAQTTLKNINVAEVPELAELARYNHFTVGNSLRLHQLVAEFLVRQQPRSARGTAEVNKTAA